MSSISRAIWPSSCLFKNPIRVSSSSLVKGEAGAYITVLGLRAKGRGAGVAVESYAKLGARDGGAGAAWYGDVATTADVVNAAAVLDVGSTGFMSTSVVVASAVVSASWNAAITACVIASSVVASAGSAVTIVGVGACSLAVLVSVSAAAAVIFAGSLAVVSAVFAVVSPAVCPPALETTNCFQYFFSFSVEAEPSSTSGGAIGARHGVATGAADAVAVAWVVFEASAAAGSGAAVLRVTSCFASASAISCLIKASWLGSMF